MTDFHKPKVDFDTRDKAIVELAVPAHMLVLVNEQAAKGGIDMRPDVVQKLNMAAAAPLANLDMFSIRRLAQRIDDAGTTLLRDLNCDDPREAIYCIATFVNLLVSEGLYADPTSNAVTVALLLRDDARDDKLDDKGQGNVWRLDEHKWTRKAKDMLRRAQIMGFYQHVVMRAPPAEREVI